MGKLWLITALILPFTAAAHIQQIILVQLGLVQTGHSGESCGIGNCQTLLLEDIVTSNTVLDQVFRACTRSATMKRAFYVALVVGIVLNLINRYDVLFLGAPLSSQILLQMCLTFTVPYMVSTHGQVSALLARDHSSG
jgi:hypothetical protein